MTPILRHFTDEQSNEIRNEIKHYLRPYRVRFYSVLIGFLVMLSIGAYGYQAAQTHAAHDNCVRARRTRVPLIKYIGQVLLLTDVAKKQHLVQPTTPQLQRLQNKEIKDLKKLYRTLQTTSNGCPS